jgi:hypothetical protein
LKKCDGVGQSGSFDWRTGGAGDVVAEKAREPLYFQTILDDLNARKFDFCWQFVLLFCTGNVVAVSDRNSHRARCLKLPVIGVPRSQRQKYTGAGIFQHHI